MLVFKNKILYKLNHLPFLRALIKAKVIKVLTIQLAAKTLKILHDLEWMKKLTSKILIKSKRNSQKYSNFFKIKMIFLRHYRLNKRNLKIKIFKNKIKRNHLKKKIKLLKMKRK